MWVVIIFGFKLDVRNCGYYQNCIYSGFCCCGMYKYPASSTLCLCLMYFCFVYIWWVKTFSTEFYSCSYVTLLHQCPPVEELLALSNYMYYNPAPCCIIQWSSFHIVRFPVGSCPIGNHTTSSVKLYWNQNRRTSLKKRSKYSIPLCFVKRNAWPSLIKISNKKKKKMDEYSFVKKHSDSNKNFMKLTTIEISDRLSTIHLVDKQWSFVPTKFSNHFADM